MAKIRWNWESELNSKVVILIWLLEKTVAVCICSFKLNLIEQKQFHKSWQNETSISNMSFKKLIDKPNFTQHSDKRKGKKRHRHEIMEFLWLYKLGHSHQFYFIFYYSFGSIQKKNVQIIYEIIDRKSVV